MTASSEAHRAVIPVTRTAAINRAPAGRHLSNDRITNALSSLVRHDLQNLSNSKRRKRRFANAQRDDLTLR